MERCGVEINDPQENGTAILPKKYIATALSLINLREVEEGDISEKGQIYINLLCRSARLAGLTYYNEFKEALKNLGLEVGCSICDFNGEK